MTDRLITEEQESLAFEVRIATLKEVGEWLKETYQFITPEHIKALLDGRMP